MNNKSSSMVNMPAPREPINQKIDTNNALVLNHNAIYEQRLAEITQSNTCDKAIVTVNPYGTAPLSLYLGVWIDEAAALEINVVDSEATTEAMRYQYDVHPGANLIPVCGMVSAVNNQITLRLASQIVGQYTVMTDALPPTDSANVSLGFPIISVSCPAQQASLMEEGLYFSTYFDRYNLAFDHNGIVRWYVSQEIPSYNFVRMDNGHFLATSQGINHCLNMYEFDIMGRVYTVYLLDNEFHHSILPIENNLAIAPSEYSNGRPDGYSTGKDGVSIINLSTGLEVAYYDMLYVMDYSRSPRPSGSAPGQDVSMDDWLHINQSYINEPNNLLICSGRHQSAIFGVNVDSGELRFIMANHEDWSDEFRQYLLTPVDDDGVPLYDLTSPGGIDAADKNFWTWGQHNIVEIPNDEPGILEFMVFDNGNYRSREDAKSLLPLDNFSRVVQFKINLNTMTVTRPYEYGKTEVGNRGYSSFVSAKHLLTNGHLVIHFGATTVDEFEHTITAQPGSSDLVDPDEGQQALGRLVLQEINKETKEVLFEAMVTSGYFKNEETNGTNYRYDISAFRVYKMPLFA
ncbi:MULTISPECIES: aryl-sulfate sulfotransferase [Salmonella]|uniref:aryl-sulfate sulfotransferase n=1 Tax=Salmonella TaxID=590 RepID=UPI0011290DDA|nr:MULTISPECIES: aryl-sulfate sulfotransferase [Salmonella]MDJ0066547.1 aryl-sulfate sulfotransferase [Salmonella sp. 2625]MDJ0079909.1 aryl-sulfate sulfotransferase [Salmonella sp. 2591]MDJ0084101.1 aryl-sulfate sulfotransferase [Salmonella sp. 2184]MDJ0142791.1 aryl-sulfate sulfotransferase [Salmonella sp. H2-436]MDJ0160386.1 aryl-sulfate sulfotransferase [Salmonella sp. 2094]